MAAERLFLDTNLLIAATDVTRVEHEAVVRAFNEAWPRDGDTPGPGSHIAASRRATRPSLTPHSPASEGDVLNGS